jgi:uncharacterized protein
VAGPRKLTREDILLLITNGAKGPFPLDPIRLMKGAFLVSQRGRSEWKELFHFEAYDYGPFDKAVYISRDALIAQGFLTAASEGRYDSYSLSESGQERVKSLIAEIGEDDAEWFGSIGEFVTSKSFPQLLREIYAAFPDFAANSVAQL